MIPAAELDPYRVQWRVNLVTNWQYMSEWLTLEQAQLEADAMLQRHNGQVRVIHQTVTSVRGLGMDFDMKPEIRHGLPADVEVKHGVPGKINPLTTVVNQEALAKGSTHASRYRDTKDKVPVDHLTEREQWDEYRDDD